MINSRNLGAGLVMTILASAAGVYIVQSVQGEPNMEPRVSREAIDHLFATVLYDVDGKAHPIAQWQGKILVINFWAPWCPPCREEMPGFSRQQIRFSEKNVQFVGIALDSAANVLNFSKTSNVAYPLLVANSNDTALPEQLGNYRSALPYTVILDSAGQIRLTRLGRLSEHEISTLLEQLTTNR